jgi:WD40 repeat protein
MRPYSAEQQIDHLDEYATGTSVKEIPGTTEYTNGVESGHTLPAKWWNWFMSKMTSNVKKIAESVDDLYAEMLDVLTKNGITPDPEETQLLSSLASLLHGDFIEKSASYSLLVTRPFVERLAVSNDEAVITLPNPTTSIGYKGAHVYNISAGSISIQNHSSIEVYSLPPLALVYVTILNGVWKIYPFIKSSSNADSFTNVQRDEEGRAQIADPVEEEDIANKKTVMDYYRNDIIDAPCTLPVNKMLTVYNPDVAEIDPLILPNDVEIGNYIMLNVVTPCTIKTAFGQYLMDKRIPENRPIIIEEIEMESSSRRLQYVDSILSTFSPCIFTPKTDLWPSGPWPQASDWTFDKKYLAVGYNFSPFLDIYEWNDEEDPVNLLSYSDRPTTDVTDCIWSSDGRYLAVGIDAYPWLIIYDIQTGTPVRLPNPAVLPPQRVQKLAWSPDGRYLALTFYASGGFMLYDWISGSPVKISISPLPTAYPGACAWSPDGRYLVTASDVNGNLIIWDWDTGSPVNISPPVEEPTSLAIEMKWSPDSHYLVLGYSNSTPTMEIYDWNSGVPVKISNPIILPGNYPSFSWSPDGRYLSCKHNTSPYLIIYDWISGAPVKLPDPSFPAAMNSPGTICWSPDGRYLFMGVPAKYVFDTYSYENIWILI